MGSDAPVEPFNPFYGIHAAVTRRRLDGSPGDEGWHPDQRISLAEALQGFSLAPCLLAGHGRQLGKISPGYQADFLILKEDPFKIHPHDLGSLKPLATFIAGECKHNSVNFPFEVQNILGQLSNKLACAIIGGHRIPNEFNHRTFLMTELTDHIPERIKTIRKSKRRSIHDCATILGLSKGTYLNIEKGLEPITLPELELLALYFEEDLSVFLNRDQSPNANTAFWTQTFVHNTSGFETKCCAP